MLAAAAALVGAPPAFAAPDTPSGGWTTDGTVYAIAHADGVTYVGGSFTHVGLRTGPGAPFDAADGTLSGSFAEVVGGRVQASAAAPDGSFYIGGDFSTVGGVARPGLARLLPDGSLDQSFAPNLACAPQSTVCTRPAVRA
ncbi:MAG: delta-60 repeat domain-containing protein, partial [Thermoleophilaceae bacterium]